MLFKKQFHINTTSRQCLTCLAYFLFMCALSMSIVSCKSALTIPYETHDTTIDMGSYTVDRPPGEGWKAVIADKQRIEFTRKTMGDDGSVLLAEVILVKTQWAKAKNIWKLSEQEVAKEYFEFERAGLERGVSSGILIIEYQDEKIIYIDNRKLYNSYSKQKLTAGKKTFDVEQSMYLYFPPGYKNDDKFMMFLFTVSTDPDSRESADLSEILPVIKSLKINPGKLNE